MRNKINWPILLSVVAVVIVCTVFAFILTKDINARFWCGYVIVFIGWLGLLAVVLLSTRDKKDAYFLNLPLAANSLIHFVLQAVIGFLLIFTESFGIKVAVCTSVLFLSLYVILTSGLMVYKARAGKRKL